MFKYNLRLSVQSCVPLQPVTVVSLPRADLLYLVLPQWQKLLLSYIHKTLFFFEL
jgi:hypothetical protein